METREIKKAIYRLLDDTYNSYGYHISIYDDIKKDRGLDGKFYYKHNLSLLSRGVNIGIIKDIYSTDITFEKLKPQIKEILGEHFGFWRKVRNLFR